MTAIGNYITEHSIMLVLLLSACVILLIALSIALYVRRTNKWRKKEFETVRDTEMLKVRIGELEKETNALHEREAELLAERDSILMEAHEQADDILERTMERVQKSETQIRQNRVAASNCIIDARRRISDLMIEVSKRLVIEGSDALGEDQITPEAVEAAQKEELIAEREFARLASPQSEPEAEEPSVAPEQSDEIAQESEEPTESDEAEEEAQTSEEEPGEADQIVEAEDEEEPEEAAQPAEQPDDEPDKADSSPEADEAP